MAFSALGGVTGKAPQFGLLIAFQRAATPLGSAGAGLRRQALRDSLPPTLRQLVSAVGPARDNLSRAPQVRRPIRFPTKRARGSPAGRCIPRRNALCRGTAARSYPPHASTSRSWHRHCRLTGTRRNLRTGSHAMTRARRTPAVRPVIGPDSAV